MAGLVCANVYALDDKDVSWYMVREQSFHGRPECIPSGCDHDGDDAMEINEGGKGKVTTSF